MKFPSQSFRTLGLAIDASNKGWLGWFVFFNEAEAELSLKTSLHKLEVDPCAMIMEIFLY